MVSVSIWASVDASKTGTRVKTQTLGFVFSDLDSKGYTGLLVSGSEVRMGVGDGQAVEIGREPQHPGFALPDSRGRENIRWCVGGRAARAREGGVHNGSRAGGSPPGEWSSIDLGEASLAGLHKTCPTHCVFAVERSCACRRQQVFRLTI